MAAHGFCAWLAPQPSTPLATPEPVSKQKEEEEEKELPRLAPSCELLAAFTKVERLKELTRLEQSADLIPVKAAASDRLDQLIRQHCVEEVKAAMRALAEKKKKQQ